MPRVHLTDDGPKTCRAASPETCPKKFHGQDSPHFDNEDEAKKVYDKQMQRANPAKSYVKVDEMAGFPMTATTKEVMEALEEKGMTAYMVGGCVRDHFLGKQSKDIDFEIHGTRPDGKPFDFKDMSGAFAGRKGFKLDQNGQAFSVLKVYKDGEDFDLALPRTEQTTGMGHTDYEVNFDSRMDYTEAASRRDFTINTMAYDGRKLVDPYNGRGDLRAGILRHVSPAFSDDPLRCLRAINFASRFNMEVAPETMKLCQDLAPHYSTLAKERVSEEFNKLLYKGEHCDQGLAVLHQIGWAQQMPGFKECSEDELRHYGTMMNKAPRSMRLAVLNHAMTSDGKASPLSDVTTREHDKTVATHFDKFVRAVEAGDIHAMKSVHRDMHKYRNPVDNTHLKAAMEAMSKDTSFLQNLPEAPDISKVTGDTLIAQGMKPGRELGAIVKQARKLQDLHPDWDADTLLRRARQHQ